MSTARPQEHATPPRDRDGKGVVGRRIAAGFIDLAVLLVLMFAYGAAVGELETDDGVAVWLEGTEAMLFIGLALFYYYACEALTATTLGKALLGLRVVTRDGGRAGINRISVRTLFRLVDGVLFYLVGLIAVLATGRRRQRIGDLIAGTTVVRRGPR